MVWYGRKVRDAEDVVTRIRMRHTDINTEQLYVYFSYGIFCHSGTHVVASRQIVSHIFVLHYMHACVTYFFINVENH